MANISDKDIQKVINSLPLDNDVGNRWRTDLFVRWCAQQVVHLWEAPSIVKQYLSGTDELLRSSAHEASYKYTYGNSSALEGSLLDFVYSAAQTAWYATTEPWLIKKECVYVISSMLFAIERNAFLNHARTSKIGDPPASLVASIALSSIWEKLNSKLLEIIELPDRPTIYDMTL